MYSQRRTNPKFLSKGKATRHAITIDEKIKYDKARYIIIILRVVTVSLIFFLCSNLHYDVQRNNYCDRKQLCWVFSVNTNFKVHSKSHIFGVFQRATDCPVCTMLYSWNLLSSMYSWVLTQFLKHREQQITSPQLARFNSRPTLKK